MSTVSFLLQVEFIANIKLHFFLIQIYQLIRYSGNFVEWNSICKYTCMRRSTVELNFVNYFYRYIVFCFSITKERTEVIFQGTRWHDPEHPDAKWLEYEFKCKPGTSNHTLFVILNKYYNGGTSSLVLFLNMLCNSNYHIPLQIYRFIILL